MSQKNFVFMTICNALIDVKIGTMTAVGWLVRVRKFYLKSDNVNKMLPLIWSEC